MTVRKLTEHADRVPVADPFMLRVIRIEQRILSVDASPKRVIVSARQLNSGQKKNDGGDPGRESGGHAHFRILPANEPAKHSRSVGLNWSLSATPKLPKGWSKRELVVSTRSSGETGSDGMVGELPSARSVAMPASRPLSPPNSASNWDCRIWTSAASAAPMSPKSWSKKKIVVVSPRSSVARGSVGMGAELLCANSVAKAATPPALS